MKCFSHKYCKIFKIHDVECYPLFDADSDRVALNVSLPLVYETVTVSI